jgi:hypothetical protein
MSVNQALDLALRGSGLEPRRSGTGYIVAAAGDLGNALAGAPNAGVNSNTPDPSLGDDAVPGKSCKQTVLTRSTMEAELIALNIVGGCATP